MRKVSGTGDTRSHPKNDVSTQDVSSNFLEARYPPLNFASFVTSLIGIAG